MGSASKKWSIFFTFHGFHIFPKFYIIIRRCTLMFCNGSKSFVRRYEFHDDRLSWNDARKFCESGSGRRLAEARTQEQFDAIFAFNEHVFLWVGGSDLGHEGNWRWNVENSPIDLTRFFNQDEPNGGTLENCLEFRLRGFNDRSCNDVQAFLCETGAIGDVPVCLNWRFLITKQACAM